MDKCYILLSLLHDGSTEFKHIFAKCSCVLKELIPRLDQQGMLEFNSTQGPTGADEPREDLLDCFLLGG